MTTYKIKDIQPNEAFNTISLSENRSRELEDIIVGILKKELPDHVAMVQVEVDVRYIVTRKPGDRIPHDFEMFTYSVKTSVREKETK
jgi:hypothetical protein